MLMCLSFAPCVTLPECACYSDPAAGAHKDAVGVCAREMGDPQLALLLARLLDAAAAEKAGASARAEQEAGPLLRHLITTELLPGAAELAACTNAPACMHECGCGNLGLCCRHDD